MQFKSDGTLKIMQITDMQEIPAISPDTLALLDAAVEAEHPDLVIYTGDQIKGYGVTYKGKTKKELEAAVAKTITALLEPVTRRHIPFAVTFGNHDRQVGISNADQFNDIYKSLPGCIGEQAEGIPGGGTYAVPLTASDGSGRTVMNLYLFDTGTDAKGGGYEAFDPAIIDWYRKTRDALKAETGHYVPSLVFQHIPMPEYYHVLRRVKKSEKGAIQAFRTHKNEFYKLGDTCRPGDMLEEPPSIPDINNGEFDALHEKGDILGVFVGHDHKNSFVAGTRIWTWALPSPPALMCTATAPSAACAALFCMRTTPRITTPTPAPMKNWWAPRCTARCLITCPAKPRLPWTQPFP